MPFLTDLKCELSQSSDEIWILTSPLKYYSELLDLIITIPVDFNSDGASVPRLPVIYELYGNRAHREGFLHDYLYRIDSDPDVPIQLANKLFLEAMKSRNKSVYVRYPMYWGVLIGGKEFYHKHYVGDKL